MCIRDRKIVYALPFEPVVWSRSILGLSLPSSANGNCEWPLPVHWNCLFVSNHGAFNVTRVSGRSALFHLHFVFLHGLSKFKPPKLAGMHASLCCIYSSQWAYDEFKLFNPVSKHRKQVMLSFLLQLLLVWHRDLLHKIAYIACHCYCTLQINAT